jgi:GNAT superfamily N-acetyltransferase
VIRHDRGVDTVIAKAGADRVDDLRELWLALHHHHHEVSELQPLVEDDSLSWQRRSADYLSWLGAGDAFLLIAEEASRPVGYALVRTHDGPDDTWPLGSRWAEIYSLSVLAETRGRGIGSALLDAIDRELGRLGIVDVAVAVQVGNRDAQRLYERRGWRPGETVMYRFG